MQSLTGTLCELCPFLRGCFLIQHSQLAIGICQEKCKASRKMPARRRCCTACVQVRKIMRQVVLIGGNTRSMIFYEPSGDDAFSTSGVRMGLLIPGPSFQSIVFWRKRPWRMSMVSPNQSVYHRSCFVRRLSIRAFFVRQWATFLLKSGKWSCRTPSS